MFKHLKISEIALILHGLRGIYVQDVEATRKKLIAELESELASKGLKLPSDQK